MAARVIAARMGMGALPAILAFTAAAALLTVTPGLDTVLVLRTWLAEGRVAAAKAVLGVQVGCFAWGFAVGFDAVLAHTSAAVVALRWAGAFYLVFCGLGLLLRRRGALAEAAADEPVTRPAFRRGLLTNLLNPKVGLFYLSFLPGFVPAGWAPGPTMVGLTAIPIALALAWFAVQLGSGAVLRRMLVASARLVRALDRITGLVFVGFGLRPALDRG